MNQPVPNEGLNPPEAGPRFVLPDAGLFAARAARFAQLAQGHPMGDFLRVMGRIAQAQHAVLPLRRAAPLDAKHLEQCRQFGMPPLSAQAHPRTGWQDDLDALLAQLRTQGDAPPAVTDLAALAAEAREALAERVLAGATLDADAALAPFVGAALQVHFTRQAAALDAADLANHATPSACPACGSRPVASVLRTGAGQGLRYAHCALCATEWHVVRIHCTACGGEGGVHYLGLSAAADESDERASTAVVRAEACDDCKSYLKIINQEHAPFADPCADDLATLMLDVLVDERGFARSGPNLLLHPGSA